MQPMTKLPLIVGPEFFLQFVKLRSGLGCIRIGVSDFSTSDIEKFVKT